MIANPFRWSFRLQCFAGFAVCALLIGYALFLQFNAHLEPCPLCIFQRIAFAARGLVFLLGGGGRPGRRNTRGCAAEAVRWQVPGGAHAGAG